MVRHVGMVAVRLAAGVEMPAGAHAVAAGAVTFFMHVKAVLCIGLEAAYLAGDHHLVAVLDKIDCAADAAAGGALQLRHGARAAHAGGAGAEHKGRSQRRQTVFHHDGVSLLLVLGTGAPTLGRTAQTGKHRLPAGFSA
ncbi:hypothetical protein D9M73_78400 [compost metagenome]